MGISIEEHIGVIEDLQSTMSVCMPDPEKTEICTSLSKAVETMRKYQKIEGIMHKVYASDNADVCLVQRLAEIREVMEDDK